MLRDAEAEFKEKFENAFAAAKWTTRKKRPRVSEDQGARGTAASSNPADGPPWRSNTPRGGPASGTASVPASASAGAAPATPEQPDEEPAGEVPTDSERSRAGTGAVAGSSTGNGAEGGKGKGKGNGKANTAGNAAGNATGSTTSGAKGHEKGHDKGLEKGNEKGQTRGHNKVHAKGSAEGKSAPTPDAASAPETSVKEEPGIGQSKPDQDAMWKEACEVAEKNKQFARRMAADSHDSRASEGADPNLGAVKTEVNTEQLRPRVEEAATSNDAESATNASASAAGAATNAPGSASRPVKQEETHTGSVFDTSKTYESSNPKAETYDGQELSPEEESDVDEQE
eukprot:12380236-Karenia_brevis.AAC.1